MKLLFGFALTVTIYGIIHYWKSDTTKRNLSALASIILIITFNLYRGNNETKEATDSSEETKAVVENPSYDYEIVNREVKSIEDSAIGDFDGYFVYAVTEEPLNKEQIEKLLHKIKEDTEDEKTEEEHYVLLYENEMIAQGGYSLGRLADLEEGLEMDAREKDWDQQPSKEEYEIYRDFIEEAQAEESLKTEEELATKISEEQNIEVKEVLDIVEQVETFITSNESISE